MGVAKAAIDKVEEALNAEGRSTGHIALGIVVCIGLVAATTAVAALKPQPIAPGAKPARNPVLRSLWPAVFSATTIAALRIWNAPSSPKRTQALALWGASQALNLALMVWRPQSRNRQLAAAFSTAGLTAAYAHAAAQIDETAANIVAPTGFAGLSALAARPSK